MVRRSLHHNFSHNIENHCNQGGACLSEGSVLGHLEFAFHLMDLLKAFRLPYQQVLLSPLLRRPEGLRMSSPCPNWTTARSIMPSFFPFALLKGSFPSQFVWYTPSYHL